MCNIHELITEKEEKIEELEIDLENTAYEIVGIKEEEPDSPDLEKLYTQEKDIQSTLALSKIKLKKLHYAADMGIEDPESYHYLSLVHMPDTKTMELPWH